MTFKTWAKDTTLRAVKTAAQTAVALLGVDQTKWLDVDLVTVAITSAFAAGASVLQNVANLKLSTDSEA